MKEPKLTGYMIYLRRFTLIALINLLTYTSACGDSFSDFFTPPKQFRQARIVDSLYLSPTPVHCTALPFQADLIDRRNNDLGIDRADESYNMVSLLECNGTNYVSPVKMQRRGSCGWYTRVAGLETLLGVFYSSLRPITPDHNLSDFLPVNLSEGYLMYSNEGSTGGSSAVLKGVNNANDWIGMTTHDAFYPDPELQVPWGDWDKQKVEALKHRHEQTSEYCKMIDGSHQPSDDQGKFLPIFECLFDVAKNKHLVFIKEKDLIKIPADMCYNTQTGHSAGKCNTLSNYGVFGDRYQVDYAQVDRQIKRLLSGGRPVRATISANKYIYKQVVNVSINPHYNFRLLAPKSLSKFESNTDKGYQIGNKKYNFPGGHSVLIVGYLEGTNTNKDFWIIKNTHTGNQINIRKKDQFFLVGTASTSGEINESYSTKRLFFLDGKNGNSKYNVQTGVEFVRLTPGTDTIKKVLSTSNDNYVLHDQDGDGVVDFFDNCPEVPNDQNDSDGDFVGDACDSCPNNYDRFQDLSDPNILLNDVDEDCVPRLCDTLSPIVGFSLLKLNATSLSTHRGFSWSLGERRNNWGYNLEQEAIGVGDLDGDGRDDFILRSTWGIKVIKVTGTGFSVVYMKKHGEKIGSWTLDKNDTYYGPGDFDHDGREEFVIFNADSGQLGIVDLNTTSTSSELNVSKTYQAGELMGGWRLGADNVISGVGDFDGDGDDEFIIRSPWGMGIIESTQLGVLKDLVMFPLGTHLGEWNFGANDRIGAVGDFNGNGQDDIILQSAWGLGIVTLSPQKKLTSTTMVASGSWLGAWHYGARDEIVTVLNADNDNKDEFILKSPWGIGIIDSLTNGRLQHKVVRKFGDSLQDWYLSKDDRIVAVGNLDGSGPDEFVMQSQQGIGIIGINNTGELTSISIHPYYTWLGNWFIRPENVVFGIGDFVSSGTDELMIKTLNP